MVLFLNEFEYIRRFSNLHWCTFNEVIQRHTPIKQRYASAYQAPFIIKKINKGIMKRSRLRSEFLNTKSDTDRKAYNKLRNFWVSLIRREKKNFMLVHVKSQTIKRSGSQ